MLGEGGTALSKLEADVREFQAREHRRVDPRGLRAVIDALKAELVTYSPPGGETAAETEGKE